MKFHVTNAVLNGDLHRGTVSLIYKEGNTEIILCNLGYDNQNHYHMNVPLNLNLFNGLEKNFQLKFNKASPTNVEVHLSGYYDN